MDGTVEQLERISHTTRFANASSSDFERLVEEKWVAAERIKTFLKDEVASGSLEPIDGARVLACAMGQVFGYEEFHKQGEIVGALLARVTPE